MADDPELCPMPEGAARRESLSESAAKRLEALSESSLSTEIEAVLREVALLPILDQERYLKAIKERTGNQIGALRQALEGLRREKDPEAQGAPVFPEAVEQRAREILESGDPLGFLCKTVSRYHKGDEALIELTLISYQTPWVDTRALHGHPVGGSGKGKSDIASKSLETYHPYYRCSLTSLSPKALYYAYREGKLKERQIIFFDDVVVNEEGIDTLKAVTSGGLIKPNLWTVDENRKFLEVLVEGRYCVVLTSVNPVNDPQLKGRLLLYNPDTSPHQDDLVWEYQDLERKASEEKRMREDEEIQICRAITHGLNQQVDSVVVPWHIRWKYQKDRRLYPFFLSLIKTVTKFYRWQRDALPTGELIASARDAMLVWRIWEKIAPYQKTKADENAMLILEVLDEDQWLTYSDLSQATRLATTQVKNACRQLEEMGLIDKDRSGKRNVYRLSRSSPSEAANRPEPSDQGLDGSREPTDADLDLSVLSSWGAEGERKFRRRFFFCLRPQDGWTLHQMGPTDPALSVLKEIGRKKTVGRMDEGVGSMKTQVLTFIKDRGEIHQNALFPLIQVVCPEMKRPDYGGILEDLRRQGLIWEPSPGMLKAA